MKRLVIIPAYNEGKSIFKVIESLKYTGLELDVLVVNDGSTDNTSSESLRAGAKVINLPCNLGIGGAVQTGYIYAYENDYDIAIQFDGDGQHNAGDLKKLINIIENSEADMALGSRFVENTEYTPSFFRRLGIGFFSKLIKLLCNASVYDTTSGYRAINRNVIELFYKYYPRDYPEVETVAYILRNGFKIKEVSVDMNYRTEGKSSITPLKSAYYMFKVTFALLFMPKPCIKEVGGKKI